MTDQEAFDKVVKHLLGQSRQALDENGDCQYRAVNGRKCAIGCLIPDEEYKIEMEGLRINVLLSNEISPPSLAGLNQQLLCALQLTHDDEYYWLESGPSDGMINRLKTIAVNFGLVHPTP